MKNKLRGQNFKYLYYADGDKMTTNIETIYDALTVWFTRLEGISDIAVYMSEMGMVITAHFINENKDIDNQQMTAQYVISKEEMQSGIDFDGLEKHIMNKIQSSHMLWEVGEE